MEVALYVFCNRFCQADRFLFLTQMPLHSRWDSNLWPLTPQSSALTTRPPTMHIHRLLRVAHT